MKIQQANLPEEIFTARLQEKIAAAMGCFGRNRREECRSWYLPEKRISYTAGILSDPVKVTPYCTKIR